MAVVRVNKTSNYTIMSNYHFKEREMTLKAKGLLSLMLSLPDTWDYSIAGLVAICKENESAINSTLKELKKFGYLEVHKLMPNETASGRIEYIYDIYEQPHGKQTIEKQGVENQGVEFQGVENPVQLSTKKSKTKQSNIKQSNTNEGKEEERKKGTSYDEIVAEMVENEDVANTIYEFIKMRKLIKKPLTDFALKRLINKLHKLSKDPQEQIAILEKSILNNWQDIFALKAEETPQPKAQPKAAQTCDAMGKYKNVYLTTAEYEELAAMLQADGTTLFEALDTVEAAIEFLSEYLHDHPQKSYASHSKAIKDWVFTALKERQLKQQEIEIKQQELAQRQGRIVRIDEQQAQFLAPNGKRLCDLTESEYQALGGELKATGSDTPKPYNWLEE